MSQIVLVAECKLMLRLSLNQLLQLEHRMQQFVAEQLPHYQPLVQVETSLGMVQIVQPCFQQFRLL